MKITGIETHVLQGGLEGKSFGWSQRVTGIRQAVLCVISTDAGTQGLGEAFYFGGPSKIVEHGIGRLGPALRGPAEFSRAPLSGGAALRVRLFAASVPRRRDA